MCIRDRLVDVPNKVRDVLGIIVDVNLRNENLQEYLEILVEPYPYPVSYKGEYHYRSGATKQELKGAALDKFLLRKQGRHWDGIPVPYVTLADLDGRSLAYFRKRAERSGLLSAEILQETDADLIDKLHLMDGAYLKRATVLLFHPDPERFVTGAFVKIGYFRNDADLLFQDEIHGSLFTQVSETMDRLLNKYLKALISYEGIQRVESYPVPEEALREAVLNAVMHKNYGSGVPIQISIYDDKIMFWNNGELFQGWTVETLLQKHSSQPFNPDVANTFFRAGMIEAWERGIEHMMDACLAADVPAPLLRYETGGLWVEFPIAIAYQLNRIRVEATQETTQETTQERILALLKAQPSITRRELAARLSVSADGIKYHLEKMKSAGIIRHVGPTKSGHWEVLK